MTKVSVAGLIPLVASMFAFDAMAEIVEPTEVGFRGSPPTQLPDGRFHATIWAQVPTTEHHLRIESVTWTGTSVRVEVLAERTNFSDPIIIPGSWVHTIPLHIENLPVGNYPLELGSLELMLDVPGYPGFRDPAAVRFWPDQPAVGEDVWLLFEAPFACAASELQHFFADSERGSARAIIDVQPVTCVTEPRLQAVNLGPVDPGMYRFSLDMRRSSRDGEPHQAFGNDDAHLDLPVAEHYSPRLGGAWFDPAQDGHGITLEFVEDDVLLFWYTFDDQGHPAWLVAQGPNSGVPLVLDTQILSGGAFPPAFDPDLVQREHWGTITVELANCSTGSMSWQTSHPGFGSGQMPLVRLSGPAGFRCDRGPEGAALRPDWYHDPATHFRVDDLD